MLNPENIYFENAEITFKNFSVVPPSISARKVSEPSL